MSEQSRSAIKDDEIFYPESDGKRMAENTKQFDLIVKVKEGLEYQFSNLPDVFVAGDLLWYPVKGQRKINIAPDAMVVFGRPKGHRGSYRQWREGSVAPQVVFEIWSPSNDLLEKANKRNFYEQYGVEEYYNFDPDTGALEGWLRRGDKLEPIEQMHGWISPRLGVRFEVINGQLELYHPDGMRFHTYTESEQLTQQERQRADQEQRRAEYERRLALQERQRAEQERQRAEQAQQKAQEERQRAEQERQRAEQQEQRAEQERQRAEQEQFAKERAWAKLRELGIDPESLS